MSKNLSKRVVGASVVAVSALLATGAAYAGTVVPDSKSPTLYAVEDIGAATPVTAPVVTYTMGVGRTGASQGFVIIYTLSTGVIDATSVPVLTYTGAGAPLISVKRGGAGANDIVFSVDVTGTAVLAGETFALSGINLKNSGLGTSGAAVNETVLLLDQGETACVDNSPTAPGLIDCSLTSALAVGAFADDFVNDWGSVTVPGVAANTGSGSNGISTVTDVAAPVPLAGFVPGFVTTPTTANFFIEAENSSADGWSYFTNNVQTPVMNSADTGAYASGAGDLVTLTITDPTGFLGLASTGLWYDLDTTYTQSKAETFAVSGNTATLAKLPGNSPAFLNANCCDWELVYPSDGKTPMGVSRVLGVAGSITPAIGATHSYTGNANAWTWTSNGTVLQTPWFTTYAGYTSRFVFQNTGTNAATYSSVCIAETGNTVTAGSAATGSLAPNSETVILATDVCTTSGNTRSSVVFTVNAPLTAIKGVYNLVTPDGAVTLLDMHTPIAQ